MQDYGYWRIKAKCVQCQLHFLICTLKPHQHDSTTLHCPECGQHSGQFIVWREEVQGSMISQEVPGNHSGKWEHPTPPLLRSWFAVWRWPRWVWGVIVPLLPVIYLLTAIPVLIGMHLTEYMTSLPVIDFANAYAVPAGYCAENCKLYGEFATWQEEFILDWIKPLFGKPND